jgi:hypothetical protein
MTKNKRTIIWSKWINFENTHHWSNTTSELTPMANQLFQYGMTLLNSDVLVCGGALVSLTLTTNCTLYVSAVNIWNTFPPLPMAIYAFAMITLHDSRPYVFGGWNGSSTLNTVYTFDTTNAWTPRAPMERSLQRHTAVVLDPNTAMVCGGQTTGNINSAQSQCSTYTISICGVNNLMGIILVSRY